MVAGIGMSTYMSEYMFSCGFLSVVRHPGSSWLYVDADSDTGEGTFHTPELDTLFESECAEMLKEPVCAVSESVLMLPDSASTSGLVLACAVVPAA